MTAPGLGKPDVVALGAAAGTAVAHLVTVGTPFHAWFIIGVCLFWIGFVVFRWRQDPTILRTWGFRSDNLRQASVVPGVFFVGSATVLAAYALWAGQFTLPPHLVVLFLLYPIWGVIQQFLVLGVVVGNLEKLPVLGSRPLLLVALGATIFGLVHAPQWMLVAGTTGLALLYVPLYLRHRNLWPLGVVHGWVGSLFYLWALGQDPWITTFG